VYIERLALTDFRSHADVDLTLAPGVVAFVGANGQGKTNLVEAIGYLATLSSHRVAQDAPLVRRGAERAYVRAAVNKEGRTTTLEVEIAPGRANRARINGSPLPRARELLGILKTVLFAPEDLALVKGEPSDRRYFLDTLLVTRTPRIAGVISDFERTLKQRNALLRSASGVRRFDTSTLDVWDEHLAEHGAQVIAARMELIAALEPLVRSVDAHRLRLERHRAFQCAPYVWSAPRTWLGRIVDCGDLRTEPRTRNRARHARRGRRRQQ
jgi:DNA replication and repair protein RecF